MNFWIYSALLLAVIRDVRAVPDVRPTLTAVYGEAGMDLRGMSPKPTSLPNDPLELFKRDVPSEVCGYVSANIYTPFTCYSDEFCGVRTDLGVVGCCTSYSLLSNGQYTLTGCAFRTICYNSAQTALCTGTCLSDPRVAFCTSSQYPYCMLYSFTDAGLSYFRCNANPGVTTLVAETYTTPSSTPATTTPGTTTPNNIAPVSSAPSSISVVITTIISSGGSAVATTISSSRGGDGAAVASASPSTTVVATTKSSILGAAVGGAVGGLAVVVIAGCAAFFFIWRNKKNKKAKAAAAAAAPTNAYNANNTDYKPPGTSSEYKAPEAVVTGGNSSGPGHYVPEKQGPPPPSYQSPIIGMAEAPSDPRTHNHGFVSPASPSMASEVDGRSVAMTSSHTAGRSELASPNPGFTATAGNDWNRPYHELE